jgi:hypothetical protein
MGAITFGKAAGDRSLDRRHDAPYQRQADWITSPRSRSPLPDRSTTARYAAELLKTKIAGADLDVLCVQAWPVQRTPRLRSRRRGALRSRVFPCPEPQGQTSPPAGWPT